MSGNLALTWKEYVSYDAIGLAQLVSGGDVSPRELAAQAAEATARVNQQINAVIEIFDDVINDPDKDGMSSSGSFHGVPMMLKDLGSRMKGRVQENGYAWQPDNVAEEDDPLTANFRQAGFNLIGRTTTPEDGMAGVTETIKFGVTRNPWNLERSAGGSSGGSSAAVAAGILPVCSASDGGGSIRLPASWNSLVGLKSTRGRLPLPTGLHEALLPSGVEGIVTRTVRDTAAIHDAICQRPLGAGFMPYPASESLLSQLDVPKRLFRVALSVGDWSRGNTVPDEYKERITEVARWLELQGHEIEEVQDSELCDFEQLFASYKLANWVAPLGNSIPAMAAHLGATLTEKNTSPQALKLIEAAKSVTVDDYMNAMAVNASTTRQWGRFWERGYDLLLTPTMGDRCPEVHSERYALSSSLSFDDFFEHGMDLCRYTMPGNDSGLPAISLPAGLDNNGCPMGVQFYAPWARETDLLHIAGQLEQGQPQWFNQLAPLNVATVKL
ncbi:amidase [Luminiphilus sp.]|nr:amidase [Luminiphilus sp.]